MAPRHAALAFSSVAALCAALEALSESGKSDLLREALRVDFSAYDGARCGLKLGLVELARNRGRIAGRCREQAQVFGAVCGAGNRSPA